MTGLPHPDWSAMTTAELAASDPSSWIVVMPIAAIEQHGPHLPLVTDTAIAEAHLAQVRAMVPAGLPVSFLPVMWMGASLEHIHFPGTLSLSAETLIKVLGEIGDSLARAGISKLVIVNAHGGNVPVMEIVARDLRARHGMLVVQSAWHRFGYPDGLLSEEEQVHGIHGGDYETSVMMAARPELVRETERAEFVSRGVAMEREFKRLRATARISFGWMSEDLSASGAMGNAALATADKGKAFIHHSAKAFVELLQDVARFELDGTHAS